MHVSNYIDLVGKPFNEIKCWDLVQEIYRRNGINIPRYDKIPCVGREYNGFTRVDEPMPGDICIYDLLGHGLDHAGIYLGENKIIHATLLSGVCIERFSRYRPRLKGVYRYNGNPRN